MISLKIDGLDISVEKGMTVLESARLFGFSIPTLCYKEGLSPWGGCRLCIVEIDNGENTKIVTSCTYPVQEGLIVRTATKRIVNARKVILELLIAQCPTSKFLQDLAAKLGLERVRFKPKWEDCIYCGLCVRMCEEQMMAKAIGFANRGDKLKITTPFDKMSDECRRCGGCIYVCPACTIRCEGSARDNVLCGRCENTIQPTCIEIFDNYSCWMGLKYECGTCVKENPEEKKGV